MDKQTKIKDKIQIIKQQKCTWTEHLARWDDN